MSKQPGPLGSILDELNTVLAELSRYFHFKYRPVEPVMTEYYEWNDLKLALAFHKHDNKWSLIVYESTPDCRELFWPVNEARVELRLFFVEHIDRLVEACELQNEETEAKVIIAIKRGQEWLARHEFISTGN